MNDYLSMSSVMSQRELSSIAEGFTEEASPVCCYLKASKQPALAPAKNDLCIMHARPRDILDCSVAVHGM